MATALNNKIIEQFLETHEDLVRDSLAFKEKAEYLKSLITTPLCLLASYPPNYHLIERLLQYAQAERQRLLNLDL